MTHALFATPLFATHAFRPRALGASFQGLCRWLVDGTPIGLKPMQHTSLRSTQPAPMPGSRPLPQRSALPTAVRLRVVRVQESGQARSSVGRMVISGRMADVCAELDRLAALETSREAALETARQAAQEATLH